MTGLEKGSNKESLSNLSFDNLKEALNLSNIIIELNRDRRIISANDNFYEISGYTKEDLPNLDAKELRSGNMEISFYEILWEKVLSGKIWNGEMENRSKSDVIYWTDTTIIPITNKDNQAISFLSLSSNITERKIAEQEIKKLNVKLEKEVEQRTADINDAISELEAFSYSVSHDLRAPLRAITGFSGMLKDEFGKELNAEANRYLDVIQNGTKQMSQLIDDLLQFSRVGRVELQKITFDPTPIVEEIVQKEKDRVDFKMEIVQNELMEIYGDPNMIKLVITNLILNAIKFSKSKESPKVHIGSIEKDKEIIFFVKDNGVGFDMRYADKLFKVFQRLHSTEEFEGTGVGLAIVARIVQKHGGRVWGESYPDSNTIFSFSLPKMENNG